VRDIKRAADPGEGVRAQPRLDGPQPGLKVIDEGVETDDQVRFLAKHRCDEAGLYRRADVPDDSPCCSTGFGDGEERLKRKRPARAVRFSYCCSAP